MNSTVDIDTATIALMNVSANAQVYEERTPNTANISVLSEKVNDNTMLVSVLSESYTGVGAYNVTLSYDNEAITPVSVKNGDLFESDVISNLDQSGVNVNELNEIKVLSFNDTDKVGEGVLFTVEFKINDEEKVTDVEITDALILTSSGDEVDFEFSETKVRAEMTVTELVLVDASGNLGKYTIEVDSNCTTDATIVVAAYNEMGKLIDMNSKDISLNKGENSFDGIPLKIKSGSENPYIVVYLWDSLSNMTPLAESVMVPVAEVVCNLAVAAIPRINSGDVVQNIKYQIQSTGETDATVITAIYNDDGRLLNSSINEVSLQFGSNTVSGISIPLEGEYVRPYMMVYLWNNIYDMIPIISPKKSYIR